MDVVLWWEVEEGGSRGRHIDTVAVEVGGGVLVQGEEKLMEVGANDGGGRGACDSTPEGQVEAGTTWDVLV